MPSPFIEVSGTVRDSLGIPYAGGTIVATLNISGSPTIDGPSDPYTPPQQAFGLDANGKFAFNLIANNRLSPAGSTWSFTVCSAQGTVPAAWGRQSVCFQVRNLELNASQDITGELITKAEPLTYSASFLATAGETIPLLHGLVDFNFEDLDAAGRATVEPADVGSQDAVGIAVGIDGSQFPPIVQVANDLVIPCVCDNQATVGHYVTASSAVSGECHDYGAELSSSLATYGQVVRANSGPHTVSLIYISPFLARGGGGGNGGGTGTVTMVLASASPSNVIAATVTNPATTPSVNIEMQDAPANTVLGNNTGSPADPTYIPFPNPPGTVTNISSGSLSPLANVTVTNPTTTPAFTFSKPNVTQGRIYGNPTNVIESAGLAFFALDAASDVQFDLTAAGVSATNGFLRAKRLTFGVSSLPLGATPPNSGEVLAFDGTNVVGQALPPFPLQVVARGSLNNIPVNTAVPGNGITQVNFTATGCLVTDVVVWNIGGSINATQVLNGLNQGVLSLLMKAGNNQVSIFLVNSSSTPVTMAQNGFQINWMVLR